MTLQNEIWRSQFWQQVESKEPTIRLDVKYGHCLCSSPYFMIPSIVQTPFGIRSWGSSRSRFFLCEPLPCHPYGKLTSWYIHTGTSSPLSFFSLTKPAVRLRHLASTTAPLFSRFTEGWRHRFFRLVKPSPRKSSLWPSWSSRYFIRSFNS